MALPALFVLRDEATPGILQLLESTTLGTNGARYRQLDTHKRIRELDHPLFLSLERKGRALGNITFCRRGKHWYIRYFAFSEGLQSGKNTRPRKNGLLKNSIAEFFEETLSNETSSFYAYIDPNNSRSRWMSDNFGFKPVARLATQSFSRLRPKASSRVKSITDPRKIRELVTGVFGQHRFFTAEHVTKPPFYLLESDKGEMLAFAKTTLAHWKIERLPGNYGHLLVRLLPFIPFLRRLLRPARHTFVVPEAVYVKNHDPSLLEELFEGILHREKARVLLWWVDEKEPLYKQVQSKIRWGLLHKLTGITPVDVVEKCRSGSESGDAAPVFVTGIDLI